MSAAKNSAKKATDKKAEPKPGCPLRVVIWRFVWVSLLLLGMGYGIARIITGTEGFKVLMEERCTKATGQRIGIGAVHSDWRFNLYLDNVVSGEPGQGAFMAQEMVLQLNSRLKLAGIEARNVELRLKVTDEGIAPDLLSDWAAWLSRQCGIKIQISDENIGLLSELSGPFSKHMNGAGIQAENVSISWWREAHQVAVLENVDLTYTPASFPERNLEYLRINIGYGRQDSGMEMHDGAIEMLLTTGRDLVLVSRVNWLTEEK